MGPQVLLRHADGQSQVIADHVVVAGPLDRPRPRLPVRRRCATSVRFRQVDRSGENRGGVVRSTVVSAFGRQINPATGKKPTSSRSSGTPARIVSSSVHW